MQCNELLVVLYVRSSASQVSNVVRHVLSHNLTPSHCDSLFIRIYWKAAYRDEMSFSTEKEDICAAINIWQI